jgi:threonine synthase
MTTLTGLQCHLCRTPFPAAALFVCDRCFGPLEPVYDYALAGRTMTREAIAARPRNLWRYRELLPVTGEPRTGFDSGFTPLVRADRLARRLGIAELYLKDDGVNHPTLSYKDRVVSIAATRAVELGFSVFACASTGNLGNSVAAHAARLGLSCFVFIPDDLEPGKVVGSAVYQPRLIAVRGNYDDVNRLCTQVADKYGWGFANINLRSYYAEGAKTYGFEIVEQLGWRFPRHVVTPVAGGTLLPRIVRGFRELQQLGLVAGPLPKMYAAQAAGSSPVVQAIHRGLDHPEPVKPNTLAKSIAIGNPADGFQVVETIRATNGWGQTATDDQILAAIHLLAETEGIFTEPAGGTTLAVTRTLIEQGRIPRDEPIVVCITGNGYKTSEAVLDGMAQPVRLGRSLKEFDAFLAKEPDIVRKPAASEVGA